MRMTLILQFVGIFLCGYLAIVAFMYFQQESFLFFPTKATHKNHNNEKVIDYKLEQGEVTLRGWLINPSYAREKLLIYFGGNAEDVFLNVDEFESLQMATLLVAYRGYGPSEGKPGEPELLSDALAIYEDVITRYSSKKIFVMGRSLGSGVACYVASKREVNGVILITPYDSIVRVAKQAYSWLPVDRLLKHRFNSVDYIQNVQSRILVIYGGLDTVVRPVRTESLLAHISREKEVLHLERADHGTIDMFPEYWRTILEFIHTDG